MRIRFDHPATARISFRPGDEVSVDVITPEIASLLSATRLDGAKVAHLVDEDGDELGVVSASGDTATMSRGRRHDPRPKALA